MARPRATGWQRAEDLLPVEYVHMVFTLPAGIAQIAYWNKKASLGIHVFEHDGLHGKHAGHAGHRGIETGGVGLIPADDFHTCQSARNFDPLSAPNNDPAWSARVAGPMRCSLHTAQPDRASGVSVIPAS